MAAIHLKTSEKYVANRAKGVENVNLKVDRPKNEPKIILKPQINQTLTMSSS